MTVDTPAKPEALTIEPLKAFIYGPHLKDDDTLFKQTQLL